MKAEYSLQVLLRCRVGVGVLVLGAWSVTTEQGKLSQPRILTMDVCVTLYGLTAMQEKPR